MDKKILAQSIAIVLGVIIASIGAITLISAYPIIGIVLVIIGVPSVLLYLWVRIVYDMLEHKKKMGKR